MAIQNVLVVDDSPTDAHVISEALTKNGYSVTQASSGEEAITKAKAEKPDLILMDVEMPGMNGFETTRAIRESTDIWFPIIFVSAKTDTKHFAEGIKSGGDIYLFKPIVPEVLEAMIHAMERIADIQDELHVTKLKMELLAFQDPLTGLVNRRGLDKAIDLEILRAEKEKAPLSVMMIDVDQFKPFNDNYGHQAGDECLKIVGKALSDSLCRPADIVARFGGEEFSVILPDTNLDEAKKIGERIVDKFKALAYKHEFSHVADIVTVSGGIAQFEAGQTADQLIKASDDALYSAKESGRNRFSS